MKGGNTLKVIYTSCYANKSIPFDLKKIGTSRGVPGWASLHEVRRDLAPSASTFNLSKQGGDWKPFYRKELEKMDRKMILDSLSDRCVLLCWEADRTTCHRSLLGDWLAELGTEEVVVVEWSIYADDQVKRILEHGKEPEVEQGRLL